MTRSGNAYDESLFQASGGPELITKLQDKVKQSRLLYAEMLDIVAEMQQRGIARPAGYTRLAPLISDATHMSPHQAGKLVQHAELIAESMTPTGHTTPATLPTVRAALHEGQLDPEHVEAIAATVKQIPATAASGARELVESTLAETARTMAPHVVREHGRAMLAHLDPDGAEPRDTPDSGTGNRFNYHRDRAGGMKFTGQLEPEAAELCEQLLEKWAKPDGASDPRSTSERLGDAFADIVHIAANPGGGANTHLVVHWDYNTLTDGIGRATLDSGCPLSAAAVRRLACDADLIPVVLNGDSVPLDVGRTRRLVGKKQREALVARDRGCAYPGCCAPARWAEAHHIKSWKDGGATDLDNLVLTCRRHHRILHESAWAVRIAGDRRPEFIPPRWIDPLQRPIRNMIHLRP